MKRIFMLLLVLAMFTACERMEKGNHYKPQNASVIDNRKPSSWGHLQTIYVFADDHVWKYAEGHLRQTLEREFFTTQNEKLFEIERVPLSAYDSHSRFNNILILGNLQSVDSVSMFVKKLATPEMVDLTKKKLGSIFVNNNLWSSDQVTVFLMGTTEENLLKLNILQANMVFKVFKEKLANRLERQIYQPQVWEEKIFKSLPYTIQVTKNYQLYKSDSANNFVCFLYRSMQKSGDKPDKYISVYTEKMESDKISKEWLYETRKRLAWKYYDQDEVIKADAQYAKQNICEHAGMKMNGRWQNQKYSVGGTFQTFAFWDEATKTAYLIDNSIYFPAGFKLVYLLELEIMSNTLKIKK